MSSPHPGPPARYPLAVTTWGEEERRAAIAVIESGETTMGPKVAAFEAGFAHAFGTRFAVMVNSGSSANLLAVAALRFTDPPLAAAGSVAVVPAVSWATTYFPLTQMGLKLRFVDIDRQTLNFDLAALARALDDEVSVVVAVNLLGNPNDFAAIRALLAGRAITLIEDNCEAMGARFEGRAAGTFGRIGTFSTFFSHHISTMEGGVCVTDDEEIHHILLSLRSHGWTRHLPWPNRLVAKDPRGDFHENFRFILPGYNVRPLEICGAIGLEQLAKLPAFISSRRSNARRFAKGVGGLRGVALQKEIGESSWFGFALTLTEHSNISRDVVVERLAAAGVESRPVVAGNFVNNPVMAHLAHEPAPPLPNAQALDERGFYIGNPHLDDPDAIDFACAALRAAVA
ncbi:MAG TPA: DegT/DnrJ/EryC1/StrS family aminotransferase [Caulobacteraceae bacterium]